MGEKPGIIISLVRLGLLSRLEADYEAARPLYEEALAIHRDTRTTTDAARSLRGFAAVCGAAGQPDRAARLFGAAESFSFYGEPLPDERDLDDREEAAVREAVSEEVFEAAWAAGRAMTLEEAVAYALEEVQDEPSE